MPVDVPIRVRLEGYLVVTEHVDRVVAEAAWITYCDAGCETVWQNWTPGTIRLGWMTQLMRERTTAI